MASLSYERSGLTSEAIGSAGLSASDVEGISAQLASARDAVKSAWEDESLGFLGCPDIDATPFRQWAEAIRGEGRFTTQVVIGVGGSSLGARAVLATAGELDGLTTHFSENMDPVQFSRLFDELDLTRTLFVVVTKSGSTIETMSKFWFAWQQLGEVAGADRHKHFVAVTDPKQGSLRAFASEHGLTTFEVPANVGGRFSVLTAVGLVPLALAGYPIAELLTGARQARERALNDAVAENAYLQSAADHVLLEQRGFNQTVMMVYSEQLGPLVEWFCQLWGESLGKASSRAGERIEIGLTPIKAIGVVDQHSQLQLYAEGPRDKHIVFVEVAKFERDVTIPDGLPSSLAHLSGKSMAAILKAELDGTRAALRHDGRPSSTWGFGAIDALSVGAFLLGWEFITAVVGEIWNINAFDQPGVELGKKIAHGLLGREGYEQYVEMASGGAASELPLL